MEFIKQYEVLFQKAKTDLKVAKIILEAEATNFDLEVIMFHLQQAVEKFLKSFLSYKNVRYPRTHDIEKLITLFKKNNIPLPEFVDEFIDLTDFAADGRYSYILDDMSDCNNIIVLIEKLHLYIRGNLDIKE
jgi:HEPN domain-containing protein